MNSYDWSRSKVHEYMLKHMHDGCCYPWPFTKAKGYCKIRIPRGSGKDGLLIVARLVCELAHGPAPKNKPVVRHLCGKGRFGCFNASCVTWGTGAENQADKIKHGTILTGEKHNMAKLTWSKIKAIRAKQGIINYEDLAKKFGVCVGTISIIQRNKIWHDPSFRPLQKAELASLAKKRELRL